MTLRPISHKRILRFITGIVAILLAVGAVKLYPALRHLEHATHESSGPIRYITAINIAQVQYQSRFGRYAWSLEELGPNASGLLPANLATGTLSGYVYVLTPTQSGYTLYVSPEKNDSGERRGFYSDETGVIRSLHALP
jgi:hypothetical protein